MASIGDLFELTAARSAPYADHDSGDVAFITNGYRDNGLLGYVTPLPGERVFGAPAICLSAFCEATAPKPPFIARGNGGSGLTILVPKVSMTESELWVYASYISNRHGWKFSFGRMASKPRLARLSIPDKAPRVAAPDPRSLLPRLGTPKRSSGSPLRFVPMHVVDLFNVQSGDFHSVDELPEGQIPLVSCGAQDNGVIGFYAPPSENVYQGLLTVAYNGDYPLMAKFHPYKFATKDDVAVLRPRKPMTLATTLFIQMLLNREVWRHSYGRKLYKARLEKFELKVPVDNQGILDETGIRTWLEANPLWDDVGNALTKGLPLVRQSALALVSDSGG